MQVPIFKKRPEPPPRPAPFEIYWTKRRMWIAVTWSVMVVALAVTYYFLIFLPRQEQVRQEATRADLEMRERVEKAKLDQAKEFQDAAERAKLDERLQLESCLKKAEDDYTALWDRECLDRGEGQDCRLPNDVSDGLNAYLKSENDTCLKRFPQV